MKKGFMFGSLILLAALALGTWATPASARSYEFEIINELSGTVSVALCYYDTDRGAWCNYGWFVIKGNEIRSIRIDNIDIRKGMAYYAHSVNNGKACIDSSRGSQPYQGWVNRGNAFRYYGSHPKTNPGGKNPQVVTWYSLPYDRDYMGITIDTIPRG
jgi:uncharacterized membrane protein